MHIQPVTLHGRAVRLEPLEEKQVADLARVGLDSSIWAYTVYGNIKTEQQLRAWVLEILRRQDRGTDLPFAVVYLKSGRVVGATRYMNIDVENRSLEIGGTWYGVDYQRTVLNTESKYLLLRYAFEELGCIRVQLKTDSRNVRSQHAIERLGAVKEGVLRNHMILPDGTRRDSVYYSIIDSEWQGVKAHLEALMERKPN